MVRHNSSHLPHRLSHADAAYRPACTEPKRIISSKNWNVGRAYTISKTGLGKWLPSPQFPNSIHGCLYAIRYRLSIRPAWCPFVEIVSLSSSCGSWKGTEHQQVNFLSPSFDSTRTATFIVLRPFIPSGWGRSSLSLCAYLPHRSSHQYHGILFVSGTVVNQGRNFL